MPFRYEPPTGERKLEFWVAGRGGERSLITHVPLDWDDDDIKGELEEWRSQYFSTSDMVRYGWNKQGEFGNRK